MIRIACACALIGLLTAGAAGAQTTATFTDPGQFSGNEALVTFDESGFGSAAEVRDAEGIELDLGNGRWPRFLFNNIPREFGPSGNGSITNFFLVPRPYPDLGMRFPEPVERVGFEAIVNTLDDLTVTLLFQGVVVDEIVMPSVGVESFYFYGVESDTSFDEVRLMAGDILGSISVDNVRFETVSADLPLQIGCESLEPAMSRWFREHRRHLRDHRERRSLVDVFRMLRRVRHQKILRADLLGPEGAALLPDDILTRPRIHVTHATDPDAVVEPVDVTASLLDGASPEFAYEENHGWLVGLPRRGNWSRGIYEISVESGDESEYTIEPACQFTMGHFYRRGRNRH